MGNENLLPSELTAVATSLEKQFQQLGLSCHTVPVSDWDTLLPDIRKLIPQWLIQLLATHSLVGPAFERLHEHGEWDRYFSFWPPPIYAQRIANGDYIMEEEVVNDGFIPLSDESDGDMWLTSITGDASSPVYLFSLTALERTEAGKNLAEFLTSFKISDLPD